MLMSQGKARSLPWRGASERCLTKLERLARNKYCPFVNYGHKMFLLYWPHVVNEEKEKKALLN
jgi:hypothetical protein